MTAAPLAAIQMLTSFSQISLSTTSEYDELVQIPWIAFKIDFHRTQKRSRPRPNFLLVHPVPLITTLNQ